MGNEKRVFNVTYQFGHPSVSGRNIKCFLILDNNELVIKRRKLFGGDELFRISYRWIESVTDDIRKEWRNFLLQWGPFLFGKRKVEQIILIVRGQDRGGNIVHYPVIFSSDKSRSTIKSYIDQEILRARTNAK